MTIEGAVPPAPPEPMAPVSSSERVETIDILRGLALFGILAANIRGFAGPPVTYFTPYLFWTALPDRIAQAFVDTFVQGKFITIFAFLFGVGFAVQFDRATARGATFGWRYARRLAILLVFGLIHGLLIWYGDILLVYALSGFLLLFFRRRQNTTVAVWAALLLALVPLLMTIVFLASQLGAEMPDMAPAPALIRQAADVYGNGTWAAIQTQRMSDAVAYNWGYTFVILWQILGIFLLGVLAWRKRVFHPRPESLPRYRVAMRWGFAVGVTGNVAITAANWMFHPPMMPTTVLSYALMIVQTFTTPALSLAYVCFVILVCRDAQRRERLHRFAAVGRTALTNYLLQSVIGTLIFYNYGLGFFGLGPAILLPLTFVIFAAQLYASAWWMARFRFGPVEWLWRRLTYSGPLPMRREKDAIAIERVPA